MDLYCKRVHDGEYPQEAIISFCTKVDCDKRFVCSRCCGDYHNDHLELLKPIQELRVFVSETNWITENTITKQITQITESLNSKSEYDDNNLIVNMFEEMLDQLLKGNKKTPINEISKNEIEDFQQISDAVKQTSTQSTIVINKLFDDFTYSGEVVHDLMHGNGQAIYHDDGIIYQGQWEFGVRCGKGRVYGLDDFNYEGDWKDGQPNGRGLYKSVEGDIYDGDWEYGRKNGRGLYKYANGNIYMGDFKDGQQNGRGLYKSVEGHIYMGDFKDGQPNGRGLFKYAHGDIYMGDFKDGEKNGRGSFKFGDGAIYQGDFEDDLTNGRGLCKYANGDIYMGDFKDGKRNGRGSFKFGDGAIYEGDFEDDQANGRGLCKYADGDMQLRFIILRG